MLSWDPITGQSFAQLDLTEQSDRFMNLKTCWHNLAFASQHVFYIQLGIENDQPYWSCAKS